MPSAHFVAERTPTTDDIDHAERLIAAYQASPRADRADDIWTTIAAQQANFFDVLQRGCATELASHLCNMARHDATRGTVQGDAEHRRISRDRSYRRHIARMTADKLVLLAEAVGAIPTENPEQGAWGESRRLALGQVVALISAKLDVDVTPPDVDGGLFKVEVGPALFGERDCNAIYTGWLLKEHHSVCEIGGGSGRVAYWASRFGVVDYTLVDLPHINVIQGFYLMSALGGAAVRLYGESADAPITILPDTSYRSSVDGRQFDAVLNQDSFPEIDAEVVLRYLGWIEEIGIPLLSINHETAGQQRVQDLAAEVGLRRESRYPYWLRKGYVAEIYRSA